MVLNLRCCRARLLAKIYAQACGRMNLRLRAPTSFPHPALITRHRQPAIDSSEHATVFVNSSRDPIVVCWHPPKPFPYEHTKAIERTEEDLRQGDSPLRVDLQLQFKAKRALNKRPLPELQNMFFTDRLGFQKKYREQRIKQTIEPRPVNRKGL